MPVQNRKQKRPKGFNFRNFIDRFSSGIMAVKGLSLLIRFMRCCGGSNRSSKLSLAVL